MVVLRERGGVWRYCHGRVAWGLVAMSVEEGCGGDRQRWLQPFSASCRRWPAVRCARSARPALAGARASSPWRRGTTRRLGARQQMKEDLGLDPFKRRSWTGPHRHPPMTMMASPRLPSRRRNAASGEKAACPPLRDAGDLASPALRHCPTPQRHPPSATPTANNQQPTPCRSMSPGPGERPGFAEHAPARHAGKPGRIGARFDRPRWSTAPSPAHGQPTASAPS